MNEYLRIVNRVLKEGKLKKNRTGIDTLSITGEMFTHNMADGFPLLTTKKMGLKNIATELEFFIKGLTDKKWLQDRGCHIWDSWSNPKKVEETFQQFLENTKDIPYMGDVTETHEGSRKMIQYKERDLGPVYGYVWRNWLTHEFEDEVFNYYFDGAEDIKSLTDEKFEKFKKIDQLQVVIDKLKTNPTDRRMIVTAWNPALLGEQALPPCHYSFQLLSDGEYVDLIFNMRSSDVPIGLPYNIASYALLLLLIAKEVGMKPGTLIAFLADVHIYVNQLDAVKEQLTRTPYELPTVTIPDENWNGIFNWQYTDFKLENYKCHEKLSMPVAV